ncbi:putative membrane protein [Mycobacterium xenopi 4042]|uniref:Putative membrane protein n=1 Tax=Mycobacterium xenopi 4042 TaxID=1299334 RepID=X7YSZ3_MYCXE|nr:putative membrane protein [Mycobacterium xenopi 4042]
MLGVHISAWRIAVAAVLCASWIAASWAACTPCWWRRCRCL